MVDQRRNDLFVILLDELDRYYRYRTAAGAEGRELFRVTARWFASADTHDPRSFASICARLGLDRERIRESLEKQADPDVLLPPHTRVRRCS